MDLDYNELKNALRSLTEKKSRNENLTLKVQNFLLFKALKLE